MELLGPCFVCFVYDFHSNENSVSTTLRLLYSVHLHLRQNVANNSTVIHVAIVTVLIQCLKQKCTYHSNRSICKTAYAQKYVSKLLTFLTILIE